MTTLNVAVAGGGAFGVKHLEGLGRIDGVRVVSLVGRVLERTQDVAARFGINHVTTNLDETLARKDVDAVILCTPTHGSAATAHVADIPIATLIPRSRG